MAASSDLYCSFNPGRHCRWILSPVQDSTKRQPPDQLVVGVSDTNTCCQTIGVKVCSQ